ncbi:NAD(P)-binding domain-containing protein, partial [uncultured Nocardioides sp.]|uniref:NAD(P)-binding domain-containing protein n=1 Tax=uncultured Nocardioides sp. TaxID=198441 RepID=UPI002608D5E6
ADRADQPFTIHLVDGTGTESRLEARAVIDASGTWRRPSPAGADGLPAIGERAAADLISYQVPDRARPAAYAGKHTVVVGSGDSAFNAVHELVQIAADHPGTRITWAIRRVVSDNTFGGGAADELPERGALGQRARAAVDSGTVQLVTGFRTAEVRREDDRAVLVSETGQELPGADTLVVLTGFRPDLSFLSEMRLDLDPTLEAPRRIATEIDPNLHSCGSVRATGAADLAQPEPDLYLVGMKSYGRAPTFLALTGYEQVRSVAAALAGDHEAAARVELVLPDTGVCGGAGVFDEPDTAGGGCCAPTPQTLDIGRAPVSL